MPLLFEEVSIRARSPTVIQVNSNLVSQYSGVLVIPQLVAGVVTMIRMPAQQTIQARVGVPAFKSVMMLFVSFQFSKFFDGETSFVQDSLIGGLKWVLPVQQSAFGKDSCHLESSS